jgi:hypothetical protein
MPKYGYRNPEEHHAPSPRPKQEGGARDRHQPRGLTGARPNMQEGGARDRHQPRGLTGARPNMQEGGARDRHQLRGLTGARPISIAAPPMTSDFKDVSSRVHPMLYKSESERQAFVQQKAKGGLTAFFKRAVKLISWPAKWVASALLGAALFPVLGPLGAGALALGAAVVTSSQGEQEPPALHLQQDTIQKLLYPFHGERFNELQLRKVIADVLSENRQANEDLAQFFRGLVPTIQQAKAAAPIHISGDVQGLIVGDHNKITQAFNGFLPRKS